MVPIHMNEKQKIEQASAEGFLELFNQRFGTDYQIIELGDAPDVRCKDSKGAELNLEVTLTEDRPRDIQVTLGRSNHRSIEALAEHNLKVSKGKEKPQSSCLSGKVLTQMAGRIIKKLENSYGQNTALIVRDTSGVDWDWDVVIEELKEMTKSGNDRFDKGIWIMNRMKTKLYQVA